MSISNPFPPPLTLIAGTPLHPPPYVDDSPPQTSAAASAVIIVTVIGFALIISAVIYLLLRFINKRFRRASVASRPRDSTTLNSNRPKCHVAPSGLFDSLPVFTFRSVTGNIGGGDCAVCLSKFEAEDQLRLLPLCCHAFHADCIDAWIVVNQTCPLCRSTVVSCDADVLGKIGANSLNRGGSFRIEIGSISRRGGGGLAAPVVEGGAPRSYSIGGSFDYVVDDNGYEIPVGSTTHRTGISGFTTVDKESSVAIPMPEPPGEILAEDVSSGRNWLREYVDRLASVSISSRAMSFRSSGRFFSGSSRRNDHVAAAMEDLEAYRVGEEISELFRWFSGV